jgi:hypothetical protein
MSTLKTTVKLESTTLFPTPINVTKISTEQIGGEYGAFQSNVIPAAEIETLFTNNSLLGNSGILYLYAESASANSAGYSIDLYITNNTTNDSAYFARLIPGDVLYLPVYAADSAGIKIEARNNDPIRSATITYFVGARD